MEWRLSRLKAALLPPACAFYRRMRHAPTIPLKAAPCLALWEVPGLPTLNALPITTDINNLCSYYGMESELNLNLN